jgi:hypothetical protein
MIDWTGTATATVVFIDEDPSTMIDGLPAMRQVRYFGQHFGADLLGCPLHFSSHHCQA